MTAFTVVFDAHLGHLLYEDTVVQLSNQQRQVLAALVRANGNLVSREALIAAIDPDGKVDDADLLLRVLIWQLRIKLRATGCGAARIGTLYAHGHSVCGVAFRPAAARVLDRSAARLVRRVLDACPNHELAEQTRQIVFGE